MHRVAFVGDVHGRRDRLSMVIARLAGHDGPVVLLGDFVNYGPDSAGVLDFLVMQKAILGDRLVLLEGNHDRAFLDFLNGGSLASLLAMGGAPTVRSYLGMVTGMVSERF